MQDESPLPLYTMGFDLTSKIKHNPTIHESTFTLSWPYRLNYETMLCVFTVPGVSPDGISAAFPFINTQPPAGRGQYVFALDAPRGMPIEDYPGKKGSGSIVLFFFIALGLLVCATLVGRRYWLSNMAEAAQKIKRYLDKDERVDKQGLLQYANKEEV